MTLLAKWKPSLSQVPVEKTKTIMLLIVPGVMSSKSSISFGLGSPCYLAFWRTAVESNPLGYIYTPDTIVTLFVVKY